MVINEFRNITPASPNKDKVQRATDSENKADNEYTIIIGKNMIGSTIRKLLYVVP